MKKFFIVALCVAGMMSSCSDIDDNIANDAKVPSSSHNKSMQVLNQILN